MVMILVEYIHTIKYSIFICICIFFANFASACTLFEPQKPNLTSDTSGQSVTLNWAGDDNDIYRLQIVANIPEGGIFWSLDTQVKGRVFAFKLPSNLAVIKVQISNKCDDTELNNVQSVKPIIFINERPSCSLDSADWLQDGLFVNFKPQNNIQSYSFSLYEVNTTSTGSLKSNVIKKFDIKPPYISKQDDKVAIDMKEKFNLNPSAIGRKYLVSVLPRCAAGQGLPIAFLLN